MKKKIGPLPLWAWGVILGVGGYFLYERYKANQAAGTSSTDSTTFPGLLDPNSVDPNTGLTYGEEEDAALNANASSALGGGGGATTESGAQGTVPSGNEFGDFLTFMSNWTQMAQALGWQPPVSQSPTSSGSGAQTVTTPSNPPTVTPAANTNPAVVNNTGAPWSSGGFFTSTLGDIINDYHSPEATARYLFAKGFRPQGVKDSGSGYGYGSNTAGQTWVYVGAKGKNPLPQAKYTIGARG